MTKSNTKTATFASDTDVEQNAGGWLRASVNPDVPTAPENVFYMVSKGKNAETGKNAYAVDMKVESTGDVVNGPVLGAVASAFNACVALLGLATGVVTGETGLKVLFPVEAKPKTNNPPVLTEEELAAAAPLLEAVETAMQELDEQETATRAAYLVEANAIKNIRFEYRSKAAWGAFKTACLGKTGVSDAVASLLKDANKVGYNVKFANAASFSFFAMLPDAIKTPRTFEKEVGAIRTLAAQHVVATINSDKKLSKMAIDNSVDAVLEDIASNGLDGLKAGMDQAAMAIVAAHAENIAGMASGDAFAVSKVDGVSTVSPADHEDAPKTLLGIEGGDELVASICKAFNNYEAAQTVSVAVGEDSADGVKALDKAIKSGNAFSAMSIDEAARHLLHILSSKLDSDEAGASADECQSILDAMSVKIEGFRDGTLSKADVFADGADVPESEDDAEDEADAA